MQRFHSRVTALLPTRADLRRLKHRPRQNLLAGLMVAIVALPLALGFGVSSGLGAAAGLTTAIIAGILAAAFGGSHLQVTGPTGAMTVVLVPIVRQHGASGVLTVGLLAGAILLGLSLARAGRYVRFVPASVVEGFTVGIAAVILLQQIPVGLGVPTPAGERVALVAWEAVTDFATQPRWPSVALAGGVAVVVAVGGRIRPRVPFSLFAVAVATLCAVYFDLPVARIGVLPATLAAPSVSFLDPAAVPSLLTAALAVAALAALESLLSATIADQATSGERHDPDRELFGQGLANLVTPLFGGVPATAAIARTAVNVRAGATSKLSAIFHACLLAAVMLGAGPLVMHIPLAALAGVLMATAVRMVEVRSLVVLARFHRAEAMVMALTASVTLAFDLVIAVVFGLLGVAIVTLVQIAGSARLVRAPAQPHERRGAGLDQPRDSDIVLSVEGPLIFATVDRVLSGLAHLDGAESVELHLHRLSVIDSTGALGLRYAIEQAERRGSTVSLRGVQPAHARALAAVGLLNRQDPTGAAPAGIAPTGPVLQT